MNNYFLNEEILVAVCLFHNIKAFPITENFQEKFSSFENRIIKDLCKKQPELNQDYEEFVETLKQGRDSPSVLFGKSFANKIEINSFIQQLLSTTYYSDNSTTYHGKRKNFFEYIFNKHPEFLIKMHNFIKEHKPNDDKVLYESYFYGLKSLVEIKKKLNPQEILINISAFDPEVDNSLKKKKINAYLKNLPNDMALYNHIMKEMKQSISKDAVIKMFWETKLKYFPKKLEQEYLNQKTSISPWSDSSGYFYQFKINKEFILEQSKSVPTKVENFNRVLHNTLIEFVQKNFKEVNILRDATISANFIMSSQDEKEKVKNFCKMIGESIIPLIKNTNYENSYHELIPYIEKHLEKIFIAFNLGNELSLSNPSNSTQKRNKL